MVNLVCKLFEGEMKSKRLKTTKKKLDADIRTL